MKTLAAFLLLSCAAFAATPRLIYSRTFPGSSPEYFRLTIDSAGDLEYSETLKDDQPPLRTHMEESETAPLFDMTTKLNCFKTPLESGLKVANTGKKTFRYEDANGVSFETTFNYSVNETAQKLLAKLEQIAASERAYLDLDRTIHFDKLGVNDALAEIEELWIRKQLAAPEQFVPLLTRVASHESFMHLARERAARLKDEFEKPVAASVDASDPK
ncbi:MAG: hypothetical protein JO210_03635 [Acidobacteriaceae bacterium]|nr:hypothetical protein [Acidobacteriaceae bacterium]